MDCPNARKACRAEIYWKPAIATSASGSSKAQHQKNKDEGHLERDGAALIREKQRACGSRGYLDRVAVCTVNLLMAPVSS